MALGISRSGLLRGSAATGFALLPQVHSLKPAPIASRRLTVMASDKKVLVPIGNGSEEMEAVICECHPNHMPAHCLASSSCIHAEHACQSAANRLVCVCCRAGIDVLRRAGAAVTVASVEQDLTVTCECRCWGCHQLHMQPGTATYPLHFILQHLKRALIPTAGCPVGLTKQLLLSTRAHAA